MRRTHPQSHATLQYCGRVTSKKRCFHNLHIHKTYDEGTSPTKSRDTFTWQIRNVISPPSRDLWTLTLAGWWLRMSEPHPQSQMTLQLCGHVTNQKYFIFIFTRRKAHNLSRVVTRMRRPHLTCHVRPWSCRHVTTI